MSIVLIAGGAGLIGTHLSETLVNRGDEVRHLSRSPRSDAKYPTFHWDPIHGQIDSAALADVDFVINLAGAGIADKPWTKTRKQLIIDSRVEGNRVLLKAMQAAGHPPKAYLSSAAIGYYGNRGDEELTEAAVPGRGFLSDSCMAWEAAIEEVAASGIRTVAFRIGLVLSTQGGALAKMLLPLKAGLATYFGHGRQWYSWIHIQDLCRFFIYAMEQPNMSGTFNAVAPHPVRNKEFAKALQQVKKGGAVLVPAPEFALRLGMGEMADAVLYSTRVSAQKALDAGFVFEYEQLEEALENLLTTGA